MELFYSSQRPRSCLRLLGMRNAVRCGAQRLQRCPALLQRDNTFQVALASPNLCSLPLPTAMSDADAEQGGILTHAISISSNNKCMPVEEIGDEVWDKRSDHELKRS